ncbi:Stomatin-like protein 2 [Oopsacas minuta]|uniref:Stomatin-like protein 2 n=1 Tax=Oopsacas minuta TaxID=111878 RepID=A0AAV7JYM5_9METZ|nr:Stomatin-like protein 2 [Oopsacas minuta]
MTKVAAERSKRAKILESEGTKASEINVAMGQKQARILLSEAQKMENINSAVGESEAAILIANGQSKAIDLIADSLKKVQGQNSATLSIARQYVSAFAELAKHSNTLILPADSSNVVSMVSHAMSIYQKLSQNSKEDDIPKEAQLQHEESFTNTSISTPTLRSDNSPKVCMNHNTEAENMSIFESTTRII